MPQDRRLAVHDIPNVALNNWVRAAAATRPGDHGLAHFFEHMMFNGTTRRQPGEFDRLMEAQGGANNAFTSDDVTVYQDWFPRNALELVLDLESDRVAKLAFVPAVIESERGVVYSSAVCGFEDNNQGLLSEQVQATALWRIHTAFRRSAGRLTSNRGAWRTCRSSSRRTTRQTI